MKRDASQPPGGAALAKTTRNGCRRHGGIELHQGDCMEMMAGLPSGSVDIVLTDPPYMYLKHRLDRPFDIESTYREIARVLRKDRGTLIVFGRGPSFYRTGTVLKGMGLRFLEEVVWLKERRSSPMTALGRVHETCSIWGQGSAAINRVRVPLVEKYAHDPARIAKQIDDLTKAFGCPERFEAVRRYFDTGIITETGRKKPKPDSTAISGELANQDKRVASARIMAEGGAEESAIRAANDDFYDRLHPTQKPVALLKRLLALVMPPDRDPSQVTVMDPFGGSFSTMAAAIEMGARGMSCEIIPDYFERGANRIRSIAARGRQLEANFPK